MAARRFFSSLTAVPRRRSDRLAGFSAPSVWSEFTPLAVANNAVNLGQGFPDWPTLDFVKNASAQAVQANQNQYCRSAGHPQLVEALAELYSPIYNRTLNPTTEITTTVGCAEALHAAVMAFVEPGDEVIIIEPAFDPYPAVVQMAGGKAKFVPLRPQPLAEGSNKSEDVFKLDMEELKAAFSSKTRMVMLNTPHNPTGKVFSQEELQQIANIVMQHPNVVVISDEVYEFIQYTGQPLPRMAKIPGMWERTLTLSSASKTFSVTGWKIGWAFGHASLVSRVMAVNQWVQFCVTTPLQAAIAQCLKQAQQPYEGHATYFDWLAADYAQRRQLLVSALDKSGKIRPVVPAGSFFVMGNTGALKVPKEFLHTPTEACPVMTRDWAMCRWLTTQGGVAAIPPSAFLSPKSRKLYANYARFAFCKQTASLEDGGNRLTKFCASQK